MTPDVSTTRITETERHPSEMTNHHRYPPAAGTDVTVTRSVAEILGAVGAVIVLWGAALAAAAPSAAGPAPDTGLQPSAIVTNHAVAEAFPQIERIGGYRPDDLAQDHATGLALDVMIPNAQAPDGVALGDEVRDYLLSNAQRFGVAYVLWRQHLYYPDCTDTECLATAGGVEALQDRGSVTANFVDHVHVTTIGTESEAARLREPQPHSR